MQKLIDEIFLSSDHIRYVAVYSEGNLTSSVKPALTNASAAESDKYEELMVKPTIMTLARQRGNIDCGGFHFALIRYGNFYQYVRPIRTGHASVCISLNAEPLSVARSVDEALNRHKYIVN